VNENTTLNKKSVKDFFKKNDVTYIEIDWTNRNADITKLLANYNRSGVPLYIFWTPGSDSPKVLPAILSESMILRLID
jgi:Thiol:disulfide interchange protein